MPTFCPGCNFELELLQVFYEIEGETEGNPIYVLIQIKVDRGQEHYLIEAPPNLTATQLVKTLFDVIIPKKAVADFDAKLRQELSKLLSSRPYADLQQPELRKGKSSHILPGISFAKSEWQQLPSGSSVLSQGMR